MPQRRTQRRVLIIGGSMSGLLAGMMLARRGWGVDIVERVYRVLRAASRRTAITAAAAFMQSSRAAA